MRWGDWGAAPRSAGCPCHITSSDASCNVCESAHGNSSSYAVSYVDIDTSADRAPDSGVHLNFYSLAGTNGDSHADSRADAYPHGDIHADVATAAHSYAVAYAHPCADRYASSLGTLRFHTNRAGGGRHGYL